MSGSLKGDVLVVADVSFSPSATGPAPGVTAGRCQSPTLAVNVDVRLGPGGAGGSRCQCTSFGGVALTGSPDVRARGAAECSLLPLS